MSRPRSTDVAAACLSCLLATRHAAVAAPPTAPPTTLPTSRTPDWVGTQTVYEVNLRQFSAEGNVAGFRKQLPRLKALGVTTLWFMPVHPVGVAGRTGKLGSPYAVQDHLKFNPEFGTLAEFKAAVDEAHGLGMHVILDWVAPHTALDHPWVAQHPDWYNHDASGGLVPPVQAWKDVAGLNYASPELRKAMIEAMQFWVREVGVDGFRCDSAEFVPLDFWVRACDALRAIKPVFMLAEGNKPELMADAFDAAFAWDLPVNMEGIVKGTKTVADLKNYLRADAQVVPAGGRRLNFTTNHDKNAFEGTTRELLGDAAPAFAVLTFTAPGIPMVFDGQEAGAERRLNLFERDPIAWRADVPAARLYAELARLKRENPALAATARDAPIRFVDVRESDAVLAFTRRAGGGRVLVALNLSAQTVTMRAPADAATLHVILSDAARPDAGGTVTLSPWGYRVWADRP